MLAGMKSEWVAGFVSESMAGFIGIRSIFGALIVTPFMNMMRIKDYAARGFAVGLTSHGIGTARAYEVNVTAGLFAGIAMALNAVATSVLAPFAARYLLP